MGEAMMENGIFANAKARALLEVVRLAFEGGIGFGPEMTGTGTTEDGDASVAGATTADAARQQWRSTNDHAAAQPAPLPHPPHRAASTGSSSRLVPGGPCMWCGVTATPQWRRPRGTAKLLCNACGIFFTRYGRLPEKSQHAHSRASATAAVAAPQPAEVEHPSKQEVIKAEVDDTDKQQPTTSTSSIAGASPHKRKDAPQAEAELLRCMEESAGSLVAGGAAAPALSSPGSMPHSMPALQTGLGRTLSGPQFLHAVGAQSAPALAAAAAAGLLPVAANNPGAFLSVAPLDLGLQQLSMQQLGLLAQPLGGLAQLPALCMGSIADQQCGAVVACMQGQPLGVPGMSGVPAELLARPFTLPPGILPSGVALLGGAAPPQPVYARASKRQERLPSGDSDDSNASTDSHAPHGDAGCSHDEDDGGTTTTKASGITAPASGTVAAAGALSCSPPSMPGVISPSPLGECLPASSLLSGMPQASNPLALVPLAGAGPTSGVALAGSLAGMGGVAVAAGMPSVAQGQAQSQQPVIYLHARRCKGPRSRAASATPSSSTQS
ncbi:hypothetical protein Agub_g2154 [Astrephomene gubernaculifera]|uniref:GATA-type domain-containing protein n=1 Tax=Astrephomene gubernaculifera TaxID=47775 RepID=A0AAD3HID8_9CHLO|nr:hypothetical protein Agub_g2154 [Astrephomene gubernaculifera]